MIEFYKIPISSNWLCATLLSLGAKYYDKTKLCRKDLNGKLFLFI